MVAELRLEVEGRFDVSPGECELVDVIFLLFDFLLYHDMADAECCCTNMEGKETASRNDEPSKPKMADRTSHVGETSVLHNFKQVLSPCNQMHNIIYGKVTIEGQMKATVDGGIA